MMRTTNRREALQLVGGALAWPVVTGMATAIGAGEDAAKPRIKIGQIGVGHAHASKLSVYRASADYEVVGIVEHAEPDGLDRVTGRRAVGVSPLISRLTPAARQRCVSASKEFLDR